MLLTRRCPKNWPPLYTFKSNWQPDYATFQLLYNWTNNFGNIKEMYKQFGFLLILTSKDRVRVRCEATPLLVFSHLGNTVTRPDVLTDSIKW